MSFLVGMYLVDVTQTTKPLKYVTFLYRHLEQTKIWLHAAMFLALPAGADHLQIFSHPFRKRLMRFEWLKSQT
jgi:hypothetical protein